jgi:hypothetical protein
MALSPDVIAQGQVAHDQIAAFISLRRRGIVYYYAGISFLLILLSVASFVFKRDVYGMAFALSGGLWSAICYFHWQRLIVLYLGNIALLDKIHTQCDANDLPWVKEARQLAAIREIQDQLAQGRQPEL